MYVKIVKKAFGEKGLQAHRELNEVSGWVDYLNAVSSDEQGLHSAKREGAEINLIEFLKQGSAVSIVALVVSRVNLWLLSCI